MRPVKIEALDKEITKNEILKHVREIKLGKAATPYC